MSSLIAINLGTCCIVGTDSAVINIEHPPETKIQSYCVSKIEKIQNANAVFAWKGMNMVAYDFIRNIYWGFTLYHKEPFDSFIKRCSDYLNNVYPKYLTEARKKGLSEEKFTFSCVVATYNKSKKECRLMHMKNENNFRPLSAFCVSAQYLQSDVKNTARQLLSSTMSIEDLSKIIFDLIQKDKDFYEQKKGTPNYVHVGGTVTMAYITENLLCFNFSKEQLK